MGRKVYGNPGRLMDGWRAAQSQALEKGILGPFLQEVSRAVARLPHDGGATATRWLDDLAKALEGSFCTSHDRQRLGFLAYTGKVENTVRDEVLWKLTHAPLASLGTSARWIGREYAHVDGVMGPGTCGALAGAAFQAKQVYVADIFDPRNKLLEELNLDIRLKAPWNLRNQSPSIQVGLLLVLDSGQSPLPQLPSRAYARLLDAQTTHTAWGSSWPSMLIQRLGKLRLTAAHSGHWALHTPPSGQRAFALHWFLVTPAPGAQPLD